ncbi:FMN-linked oxidoreductase [Gautieria morchelliformis]|nr:FMN-linked oxidoreductase [Gautieria morchelliformis]
MTIRTLSSTPSPPPAKRQRLDIPTCTRPSSDFRDGLMLAPMVRSGSLPTRLFALKHGAKLVWGPEIVDKAILHSKRVVNPVSGTIDFNGISKPIFSCHPLEKPYLIYQIGSADPELAVQAARLVRQDVSGVDLNCGCPKPFSTHSGMGAALLTNPDLLCAILTALRKDLPPEMSVSAKIRLLPSQEDTLQLVKRIVDTGVSAITVHCRTRNMRPREKALVERMREIVEYVEGLGVDVAVIENGDCLGYEDAKRIKDITGICLAGAHSVMIATAAESNPTCFDPNPFVDLETTLLPAYVQLARYLSIHWSNTKFCVTQFKGPSPALGKARRKEIKEAVARAKGYDMIENLCEGWRGEEVLQEIENALMKRMRMKSFTQSGLTPEARDHVSVQSSTIDDASRCAVLYPL